MQYTFQIFERALRDMPPLVPEDTKNSVAYFFDRAKVSKTRDDLEALFIAASRELWPYNRAFSGFVHENYQKLAPELIIRYGSTESAPHLKSYFAKEQVHYGLFSGEHLHRFDSDLRHEIMEAILRAKKEIERFTNQQVLGEKRRLYEQSIYEYSTLLDAIDAYIEILKQMALDEKYQDIAPDIYAKVQATNEGFAGLGPYIGIKELENYIEHIPQQKKIKLHYLSAYV